MKKKLRDITVEELLTGRVEDENRCGIISALEGYSEYGIPLEDCGYDLDQEFEVEDK